MNSMPANAWWNWHANREALDRERVLAVAQTWDDVRAANDAIRTRLRETGKLGAGRRWRRGSRRT
ncbi:hypothetical protein OH491_09510 [Termitidicoccus mucosus]